MVIVKTSSVDRKSLVKVKDLNLFFAELLSLNKDAGAFAKDFMKIRKKVLLKMARIENHAEDIKLSTLEKFTQALGKKLRVKVA